MHIGQENRNTQLPCTSAATVQEQQVLREFTEFIPDIQILKNTPGVQEKATCITSGQQLRLRRDKDFIKSSWGTEIV